MHEAHMQRAVALSRRGMELGHGGPFRAVIVKDGAVVGQGWNRFATDRVRPAEAGGGTCLTSPAQATSLRVHECHRAGHCRTPRRDRPPPGRNQGVERGRADSGSVNAVVAVQVAPIFLAEEGGGGHRSGEQRQGQAAEEAPGDVECGEKGSIGAHDCLLGRTAEEGRQEVGARRRWQADPRRPSNEG